MSPRIALRRWPMCAALLGLMRSMFNEHVAAAVRWEYAVSAANDQLRRGCAVEARVDIACAGNFKSGEAFERDPDCGDDFLRDDFWRLAQFARQLESNGRGDFAECAGRAASREGSCRSRDRIFLSERREDDRRAAFQVPEPRESLRKSLIFKVILAPAVRRALIGRRAGDELGAEADRRSSMP